MPTALVYVLRVTCTTRVHQGAAYVPGQGAHITPAGRRKQHPPNARWGMLNHAHQFPEKNKNDILSTSPDTGDVLLIYPRHITGGS